MGDTEAGQQAKPAPADTSQSSKYTLPQERYKKAIAYSRAGYTLYFVRYFSKLLVLILILRLGLAAKFRDFAERMTGNRLVQGIVFIPVLMLTLSILDLPFRIDGHSLSLRYEQSVQRWGSWMWDWTKGALLEAGFAVIFAMILFAVIRRSPRRWWLYFWIASLPIIFVIIFVSPWFIDPLFNKFEPLDAKHSELVSELEKVANRAGLEIPRERMFLMEASEKTKQLDAYVTGFGASKRVVVWDTTIEKTTTPETLFIFGHEAGHYELGHIRDGFFFFAGLFLAALYAGFRGMYWALKHWASSWKIRGLDDWASFAVFLLLLHIGVFLALPVTNGFSRVQEHAADVYGLEVIHGIVPDSNEVAAHAFQVFGEVDLADPDPPKFITFWLYSHPPLADRLAFAHSYDPWSKDEPPRYIKQGIVKSMQRMQRAGTQAAGRCVSWRRANAATLWRLPQRAIEHQRRRRVRDMSEKKSPQPGLAQTRRRAADPSRRISAAERAMAAKSQSRPSSRAMNSRRHSPFSKTSSSCPSVMRRISLIGSTHSLAILSLRTIAEKI